MSSGNAAAIDLGVISRRVSIPVALALAGRAALGLLTPQQLALLARATVAAAPIYKLEAVVKSAFVNGGLLFGTLVALEGISKALQNLPDNPNPPAPPLPPFTPPAPPPPLPPFNPPVLPPQIPPFNSPTPPSQILENTSYNPPKDTYKGGLTGFPGTKPAKPKTPVSGGGKLRPRWKDPKGNIYEWDYKSGKVEKYDKRGNHQGEFDPEEGTQTKKPDRTRKIEP
ncbi:hypothetical protein IQ247_22570 [Plectonema cf. radiosum LEGE 06105]|uniref:Colicin E3-like ribonuclease domain-containing protein n=1 Tax=Plectonema cf. radiosum LEGE 06105 TaxID=945769 RepID=A0A8J7F385_9CYAN|nr:colicin E3/pyocin S6 family cytotoxin [Plectonema radiosum]MBE9215413.1 hypothetical protein [Plectonema cf. radiosum LEGE 06105]